MDSPRNLHIYGNMNIIQNSYERKCEINMDYISTFLAFHIQPQPGLALAPFLSKGSDSISFQYELQIDFYS